MVRLRGVSYYTRTYHTPVARRTYILEYEIANPLPDKIVSARNGLGLCSAHSHQARAVEWPRKFNAIGSDF